MRASRGARVCGVCAMMVSLLLPAAGRGQDPGAIPPDQLMKLHALISPARGELRFYEIPWLVSVWEAREKAAREGKPLLVWSGSGGAPLGVC